MFAYSALSVDQAGYIPRNGDADLSRPWPGMTTILDLFNRSDWRYVLTNGKEGTMPASGVTILFPWAGQFIMRSGYEAGGQWAYFDVGPYGSSGHAHRDKLHLNIRAYNSLLLVDSGRFAYNGDGAIYHRDYAPTTRAHNTLTLDNCDQQADPALAPAPVANNTWESVPDHDWAVASQDLWDGLKGSATHTRAVYYNRGNYWVVADVVDTDRPRYVEVTWHTHTESKLVEFTDDTTGAAVVAGVPSGFISIIPAQKWTNHTIARAEQPPKYQYFQGWFSRNYSECSPSSVLVYKTTVTSSHSLFVWLLLPSEQQPVSNPATIEILSSDTTQVTVQVTVKKLQPVQHVIPLQPKK